MKRIITYFIITLVLAATSIVSAQEIEKSTKTEFIGNTEYYIHTVTMGQTIYAISKAYTVSMDEILNANPEAKKGIKTGSILKIPVNKSNEPKKFISHVVAKGETLYEISFNYNVKVADILNINPGIDEKIKPGQVLLIPVPEIKQPEKVQNNTSIHIVQKGETLFSIARQYSMNVEDLKKINPGLTESIQVGQQIKLSVGKVLEKHDIKEVAAIKDSIIKIECGKTGLQNSYRIALLIPFYLDKTYTIDTTDDDSKTTNYKSFSFIQFYEGVRIALDSLENSGLSLTVYVYDVNEGTDAQEFIDKKKELKNMDLIIGPFFMSSYTVFAEWAKQNNVNIVNPFTKKGSAILNNPNSFKLIASDSSQASKVLSFISETYPGCNVLIVHRNADTSLVKAFENNAALLAQGKNTFTYHVIEYAKKGYAGISGNLTGNSVNVIITLADGEAFVSAYLRNLNESAHTYKILLFGQPSWEQYSSLDLEYLMNLNLHIFESYFLDYSNAKTKDFIKKYRRRYNTDPNHYAFHGYDIMMYFSEALKKFGRNFKECLSNYNPELLETEFIFRKTDGVGYENSSCMIYRYENYKVVNAILNPQKDIRLIEKKKP